MDNAWVSLMALQQIGDFIRTVVVGKSILNGGKARIGGGREAVQKSPLIEHER